MNKPSAVIDKSLFHELCKIPDSNARENLWQELHNNYQLVVPLILIEETVANAVQPGTKPTSEVQRLVDEVASHSSCWLEDMYEIAFAELVGGKPLSTLPALSHPVASEILQLRWDDESLKAHVQQRKQDSRATHDQWKAEQNRLTAAALTTELKNEGELFNVVLANFLPRLKEPAQKNEMLETILGNPFRRRHKESANAIDDAFSRFTPETFTKYYVSLTCINCRLAFFFAPIYTLPGSSSKERLRFLRQDQNNFYDAEYVSSALICERFLTRDEQQARMCHVFKLAQYWKGEVVFVSPKQDISTALPKALV
jgi:hypothetical protein